MGVESIGGGIATRLETITGLRVFAPSELPDTIPELPCAIIMPPTIEYDTVFRGGDSDDYVFRIILLFSKQDSPSALNKLADYTEQTGTYSVQAAIDADNTLESTAEGSRLTTNSGASVTVWGGQPFLSTEFELLVWS